MRTVAHISDLHFGRTDPTVLPRLREAVVAVRPDVVVVSGDLTQRAKWREFMEARAFLDTLPKPQIVVPGNHDVPLYNVLKRWLWPLDNFRRYISNDLQPLYRDAEIAVLGVNTARSLTFKNGRINSGQIAHACSRLEALSPNVVRIVVTHHPFAMPDKIEDAIVGRAHMAIAGFARCKVDMILSGHLHTSHTVNSVDHYAGTAHSALLVQAGTATSTRMRGEVNSFNLLRIERPQVHVERMAWDEARKDFALAGQATFALPQAAGAINPAEAGPVKANV